MCFSALQTVRELNSFSTAYGIIFYVGLPRGASWQDLKDLMRQAGEVCYANVYSGGTGIVEFLRHDDLRNAVSKFNNYDFRSKVNTYRFNVNESILKVKCINVLT